MITASTAPQRSKEWFAARRGIPTASRFDQIITAAKGARSSAQDTLIAELLAESLLPPQEGLIPQFVTPEMEHGMIMEAEARCAYELEFAPAPVVECGFVLHASGLFGGSPDGLVGEDGGVEIKCPAPATHIGYVREGTLPDKYKAQVHGYMITSGREWWDFFSYFRGLPPLRVHVPRDDFTARLHAELLAFSTRYNEARAAFNLPPILSHAIRQ